MISEGDQVIIKTSKVLKPFQIRKSRLIRVEKSKFRLDGAIGFPFGTTFEVQRNELVKVRSVATEEQLVEQESERDNRHLKDDADNQKLTKEELQTLRKKGADVVEQLIENSATFKEKTEFAQQKYIKKKKKKWEARFTIVKPNTRLVADMYYSKGPSRICNLRHDSLAQLMTYANVRAHAKIMLCESVAGLVLGTILERLGGYGCVVQFYTGSHPSREALEVFGFSPEVKKTMMSFPLIQMSTLKQGSEPQHAQTTGVLNTNLHSESSVVEESSSEFSEAQTGSAREQKNILAFHEAAAKGLESSTQNSIGDAAKTDPAKESVSENISDVNNGSSVERENDASDKSEDDKTGGAGKSTGQQKRRKQPLTEEEKTLRRERREAEHARTKELLEKRDMDALIVASKMHPTPIVMGLIDFLAPGRPLVVHSMYKESLLDCYVQLRNRGGVVNLKLSETWLRSYQVLPMRTHPVIQMSGTGGYLLTGTTTRL